jgi:hypothetical protein
MKIDEHLDELIAKYSHENLELRNYLAELRGLRTVYNTHISVFVKEDGTKMVLRG